MFLQEILKQVPGTEVRGNPLVRILGISYDSRNVRNGHLFVAMKGEKADGNQFVGEAIERGAAAVASEHTVEAPPEVAACKDTGCAELRGSSCAGFFWKPRLATSPGGHYRH